MYTKTLLLSLAVLASSASGQVQSPLNLDILDQEWTNAGFPSQSLTGFGLTLAATAFLAVEIEGNQTIQNGLAYSVAQVAALPTFTVAPTPSAVSAYSATAKYTLMLADAASLGDPDVQGNYRHYLANNLGGGPPSGANATFVPTGGNVITSFAAPGPIAGTGPHRYAWMLFLQPSTFTAPANLSTATSSGHWNVSQYVTSTNLQLVAASFFTVENGTPTGSVVATSAVDTSSIAASFSSSVAAASSKGSSSAGGKTTSAPTGSATTSSAGSSSTTSTKTGAAGRFSVGPVLAGLAFVAGSAVLVL